MLRTALSRSPVRQCENQLSGESTHGKSLISMRCCLDPLPELCTASVKIQEGQNFSRSISCRGYAGTTHRCLNYAVNLEYFHVKACLGQI
jgi:hypothetical protein